MSISVKYSAQGKSGQIGEIYSSDRNPIIKKIL